MYDNKVELDKNRTMFEAASTLKYSKGYDQGYIVGYAVQDHIDGWDTRRKFGRKKEGKFARPFLIGKWGCEAEDIRGSWVRF